MDRETTDRIIDEAPEDAPMRRIAGGIDRIVATLIRGDAGTTS